MELWELKQRQSLPLEGKIMHSQRVIREWYDHWEGNVYVAFSGGKDSTVLLHLVRQMYPSVPAVFVDTGLEYPEIRDFVKTTDNVTWLKPTMTFKKVIEKYGYPCISKRISQQVYECRVKNNPNMINMHVNGIKKDGSATKMHPISKKWRCLLNAPFKVSHVCCSKLKKGPLKKYEKEQERKGFVGISASEGGKRELMYLQRGGCNAYDRGTSWPLAIWNDDDVWEYIKTSNLSYSEIYNKGWDRTGCMFCMFGCHLEGEPNRFQRMANTHPNQYDYCMNKLGLKEVLKYMGIPYRPITTLESFVVD